MPTSLVDQADLESAFTKERVAEVFSVQDVSGVTTGVADAASLAYAIRMGSAEVARMLIGAGYDVEAMTPATCPDTIKQLALPIVMHQGMLRRPDFLGKAPKDSPYFAAWEQARKDLDELRKASQRVAKDIVPANVGGSFTTSARPYQRPHTFLADPTTGKGGFNDGSF